MMEYVFRNVLDKLMYYNDFCQTLVVPLLYMGILHYCRHSS